MYQYFKKRWKLQWGLYFLLTQFDWNQINYTNRCGLWKSGNTKVRLNVRHCDSIFAIQKAHLFSFSNSWSKLLRNLRGFPLQCFPAPKIAREYLMIMQVTSVHVLKWLQQERMKIDVGYLRRMHWENNLLFFYRHIHMCPSVSDCS